jgi:integral membrane sensor domain MASE1
MVGKTGTILIVFGLIMFANFFVNQEAFGYNYTPSKDQKQTMGLFFVIGFTILYGIAIYLDKVERVKIIPKIK